MGRFSGVRVGARLATRHPTSHIAICEVAAKTPNCGNVKLGASHIAICEAVPHDGACGVLHGGVRGQLSAWRVARRGVGRGCARGG